MSTDATQAPRRDASSDAAPPDAAPPDVAVPGVSVPDAALPDAALLDAALLDAARAARLRAHAPYSRFRVGAAVRDEHGRVHAGCNVENAAYPEGVCAEAGAISAMVLAGGTRVTAVAVVGEGDGLVTPCGGCRQKIREFAAAETPVIVGDTTGLRARFTLAQLLPNSFGPEQLR